MKKAMIVGFSLLLNSFSTAALSETKVSIAETCSACKSAGVKPIGEAVQSPLRLETSLIGLSYINYIYQNDLTNEHFCQAMLLMDSQVPA